jgi:hypothetical protein
MQDFPQYHRIGTVSLFLFLSFNATILTWSALNGLGTYGSTNIPLFLAFISPLSGLLSFGLGGILSLTVTKWISKAGLDSVWRYILIVLFIAIIISSYLLITTPEN